MESSKIGSAIKTKEQRNNLNIIPNYRKIDFYTLKDKACLKNIIKP